jgi:apolipoprotein N-acyltransferase
MAHRPTRLATSLALAAGSGVLCALAFPPYSLSALAFIAFAPLIIACHGAGFWRGILLGFVHFATFALLVVSWLPELLGRFVEGSPLQLGLIGLALGLYLALPAMAFAGWLATASAKRPVSPLEIGLFWGLLEVARTHAPGLEQPFYPLGAALFGMATQQAADLFGVSGISALLVAVGSGLPPAFSERVRVTSTSARSLGLILSCAAIYGAVRGGASYSDLGARPMAVVQGGAVHESFLALGDPTPLTGRYVSMVETLMRTSETWPSRGLVVLPESAINVDLDSPLTDPELVEKLSPRGRDVDVIVGGVRAGRRGPGESPHIFNTVFLLRGGEVVDRFDKRLLLPVSERPISASARGSGRAEMRAGSRVTPLPTEPPSGPLICSEGQHPSLARELARAGAQVLLNPSNDNWFPTPASARVELESAAVRAIETRRPLIRPTTTGYSAIIDATGRILVELPFRDAGSAWIWVEPSDAVTPYLLWGDLPLLLFALLVAIRWVLRVLAHARSTRMG